MQPSCSTEALDADSYLSRVTATALCGSDLHYLRGLEVPESTGFIMVCRGDASSDLPFSTRDPEARGSHSRATKSLELSTQLGLPSATLSLVIASSRPSRRRAVSAGSARPVTPRDASKPSSSAAQASMEGRLSTFGCRSLVSARISSL